VDLKGDTNVSEKYTVSIFRERWGVGKARGFS
jgi:hypothetical protein